METANLALVLTLVLITGYYARETRRSVDVMEQSLRRAQMPSLGLQVAWAGEWAGVRITNVGAGPAFELDLQVEFVPVEGLNRSSKNRRWRISLMPEGRRISVSAPEQAGEIVSRKTLCHDYDRVRLTGSFRDSMGIEHSVHEELVDLRAFDRLAEAGVSLHPDDLSEELREVGWELHQIRHVLEKRLDGEDSLGDAPPPPDDDIPF